MVASFLSALASRGVCLIATVLLAFVLAMSIGDPTSQLLDPRADAAERHALRKAMALDQPIAIRLTRFVGSAIAGDLGRSWQTGRPVARMIMDAGPATLDLALSALLVSLAAAIPLAITAASRPGSTLSRAIHTISLATAGLPTFITAVALIAVFSAGFGILPAFGRGATASILGWPTGLVTASGLAALCLPVLTLVIALTGLFVRIIECELSHILKQDFIAAARSRGTGPWRIHFGHALANAWPPLIATASVQLGNLTAFAFVTETVFQRPGLGLMFLRAIEHADIPVITCLLLLAGVVFAACGLAADLLLALTDPRSRDRTSPGSAT